MKKIFNFLKWIIKSILFGLLILFIFNVIGSYLNMNIPVNIYTVFTVGLLRIPGLLAVIIITLI